MDSTMACPSNALGCASLNSTDRRNPSILPTRPRAALARRTMFSSRVVKRRPFRVLENGRPKLGPIGAGEFRRHVALSGICGGPFLNTGFDLPAALWETATIRNALRLPGDGFTASIGLLFALALLAVYSVHVKITARSRGICAAGFAYRCLGLAPLVNSFRPIRLTRRGF